MEKRSNIELFMALNEYIDAKKDKLSEKIEKLNKLGVNRNKKDNKTLVFYKSELMKYQNYYIATITIYQPNEI